MTCPSGHRILVVEDNAHEREDVCALLESLGESVRAVETVDEALVAIEVEEFCGYVFDQALPLRKGASDFVTGGERIVRAARAKDRRRSEEGGDVTPIVAFTSHSEKAPFVTGLFEAGITTFVTKPLCENQTYFVEKYRGAFVRAGRGDHAQCAALAQRRSADGSPREGGVGVSLAIDGKVTSTGRSFIEVGGTLRDMQDSKLIILLRCILARENDAEAWSSRLALGIGDNRAATTHVRDAFRGLVPEGFEPLEGDDRGNFRLNLAVVVERVDWDALAKHPNLSVRRVAIERQKRVKGR